jgi:sugar-phosphatase
VASTTRRLDAAAILFDMDGVLVNSSAVVERAWRQWALNHGFDVKAILAVAHGRRTRDTVAEVAPHLDAAKEGAWLDATEQFDFEGMVPIPGAARLLESLPRHRWAIVTSAHRSLAIDRLTICGLTLPEHLVSSDQIERGKPHPDGYLLGARQLGVEPGGCVVFEDSPPGIEAGRAAGMRVVGLATTYASSRLHGVEAIVQDLSQVTVRETGAGLAIDLET